MRSDYPLYAIAILCFIIAVAAYATLSQVQLYVYALAVIGIIFFGLGYMARPKEAMLAPSTPSPAPPPTPEPAPKQQAQQETETLEKTAKPEAKKTTRKTTRRRRKKT